MKKTFEIRGIEITIYCDDLSEPGTVSKLECEDMVGLLDILDHKAELWPCLRGESNLEAICQMAVEDEKANGSETCGNDGSNRYVDLGIKNLTALIHRKELTPYQYALAMSEWNKVQMLIQKQKRSFTWKTR